MPAPPHHPRLTQAFALSNAGRNAEAILLINQLAAAGDPGGLFTLAEMKWRGGIVPQDLAQARDLYRRAGEAGHPAGAANHTNLLASGIAGPRNWPLALKRLKDETRGDPTRKALRDLILRMELTPDGEPASLPDPQILSEIPHARLYPKLLTPQECTFLRAAADQLFAPSTVHNAAGQPVLDPIRQSDGAALHWLMEDPAIHALNRRLAAATRTDANQGEALQILRYRPGQQYRPHLDQIRPDPNPRGQTALVYLNQDYDGGETEFVKTGLRIKGQTGDALVFRNLDAAGRPDPMSEHAGCPIIKGTKFLASRWIHVSRWAP